MKKIYRLFFVRIDFRNTVETLNLMYLRFTILKCQNKKGRRHNFIKLQLHSPLYLFLPPHLHMFRVWKSLKWPGRRLAATDPLDPNTFGLGVCVTIRFTFKICISVCVVIGSRASLWRGSLVVLANYIEIYIYVYIYIYIYI